MKQIGIIGFGRIAAHHAAALLATNTVELFASSRSEDGRRRALASGAKEVFEDYREMASAIDLDGWVVTVPVLAIPAVLDEVLPHRIPVLVEKPVGLHPIETIRLARRADEAGCPVMVALNRRFYGNVQRTRSLIAERGPLLGITVNAPDRMSHIIASAMHPERVLDAWLYANIIHSLDLVRFWGGEVTDVYAWRRDSGRPHAPSYVATMLLDSGALAQYTGHFAAPGKWTLDVYLPGSRISFRGHEEAVVEGADGSIEPVELDESDRLLKSGFLAQARHFLAGIGSGVPAYPGFDLWDAARTMELIRRIADGEVARPRIEAPDESW